MAETLISPGVFLQENDLSQITQGPIAAGAALVGPTVIGPVDIPTYITSYSQYKALFGAAFISGGTSNEYLTSMAALNYFEQGGNSLLVTRVASGSYSEASASIPCNLASVPATYAAAKIPIADITGSNVTASNMPITFIDSNNIYTYLMPSQFGYNYTYYTDTLRYGYFSPNAGNSYTVAQWSGSLISFINNNVASISLPITASSDGTGIQISGSSAGVAGAVKIYTGLAFGQPTGSAGSNVVLKAQLSTPTSAVNANVFDLETLSVGTIMNNASSVASNGLIPSGSSVNVRWEIVASDSGSGQFSLIIRRGDDYENSKTVLESWNNLSLDPNQANYISYIIGDQSQIVLTDEFGNSSC